MKHWLTPALLAATLVGGTSNASADSGTNPLLADQWQARPLILVTPDTEAADYQRIRGIIESHRDAFNDRDMVLYTVENGVGQKAGRALTEAETQALLSALGLTAEGPLTTVLVGKDGGKKVEQQGFTDPRQVYDTIDRMPMRQTEQR